MDGSHVVDDIVREHKSEPTGNWLDLVRDIGIPGSRKLLVETLTTSTVLSCEKD